MKVQLTLACLLAIPAFGCNPDIVTEADETRNPDQTLAPTPTPNPDGSTPVPLNMTGTFAYKTVMTQEVENAFDSSQYDLQTVKSLHVLVLSGETGSTELTFASKLCSTELSEVSSSLATLTPGFFAAVPVSNYTATLSSLSIGADFELPQYTELRGVNLDDPTDPMPKAADSQTDCDRIEDDYMASEGVYDFDGDGNPGFTIDIDGAVNATLFTIERFTASLEGTVYSQDYIGGDFRAVLEDVFICSTKPSLVSTEVDVIPDDNPASNFFEMVRIPEGSNCAYVTGSEGTIFAKQAPAFRSMNLGD